MAINPINSYAKLRLIGLSSGMDTDSIIRQMMRISQMKIDTRFRAMKKYEWKQDALKDVSELIKDFRWKYFIGIGEGAVAMRQEKAYNSTVAVISGNDKNKDAVTITTSTGTPTGKITIGQIVSLAENNSVSSSRYVSASGNGFNMTEKLGEMSISNANITFDSSTGNANVSINGSRITLNRNDTISDINGKIRAQGGREISFSGGYATINVNGKDVVAFENEFYNSTLDQPLKDIAKLSGIEYDTARLKINGQYIDVSKNNSLTGINAALGGAIKFDYTKVNINGTDVELHRNDSFADINSKLVAAGGTALTPVGGHVIAKINGVDNVDMNIGASDVFGEINSAIVAAGGSPAEAVKFDIAKVNIMDGGATTGGADINIYASEVNSDIGDIFGALNSRITAAGGAANTIKFDHAQISVDTTSGTYSVLVTGTDTLSDVNKKIEDDGGPANAISLDGNDLINGIGVGTADFTKTTPKAISDTGLISKANAAPLLKGFDEYGRKTIMINGVGIELDRNMTIEEMCQAVNKSAAGVTMSYSKLSDSFMLTSKNAGESVITTRNMEMFGISNGSYSGGSYARVWIDDGVHAGFINSNSNTIEMNGGVKIALNYTTNAGDDPLVVSFKRDATEAMDKIRSMVEGYNTLIQKLEDMLKETKNSKERAYGPLTDEEKEAMTEKQIEDWEAIAKKGILRSDAGIQNMLSGLRNALYSTVKSAGCSPADIGVKTGMGTGGMIILDEDALRAALERDPDKVMNAFIGGEKATAYEERGLLWRMDDIMQGYEKNSQSATLSSLASSIKRENEQIEKLQKKMWEEEEKLYAKFAAMETALSKLQSQTDWMNAMLGASNNNNNNR